MDTIETLLSEIQKDYHYVIGSRIMEDCEKTILQDSKPLCCRFCGKTYPDVQFKNEAHVIPEFIGNKKLISKFECDACNSYFSQFETQMANYMLPHHSMSGTINKKNKVPKYNQKGQPIIENDTKKIVIIENHGVNYCNLDKDGLHVPIKIPPYIPEYLYRCLVKIAISILPETNLVNYRDTISWLMNTDLESNIEPYMTFSIYAFCYDMGSITSTVWERNDDCIEDVPFSIFTLNYKNFGFQIYLPFTSKEIFNKSLDGIPFIFPTILDRDEDSRVTRRNSIVDLRLREKKTDDVVNFTVTGEYVKNTAANIT